MRFRRRALAAALPLLLCAGVAHAEVTLTITPNKTFYSVGETITLTISATVDEEADNGIFGRLLYSSALTNTVSSNQTPLTSDGGSTVWTEGGLQTGDGFADAFNQVTLSGGTPDDDSLVDFATVTLTAEAPGQVNVSWDDSGGGTTLIFFGLSTAPGASFTIGESVAAAPFVALPNIPTTLSGPVLAGGGDTFLDSDIDGDGAGDLVARSPSGSFAWYQNDGAGGTWTEVPIGATPGSQSGFNGDFDGDGDQDVVVADHVTPQVVIFENLGDGLSWGTLTVDDISIGSPFFVFPADVNGDGALDILYWDQINGEIGWYDNVSGDASSWVFNSIAFDAGVLLPSDVDRDGDTDVVLSAGTTQITWYENLDGSGTSWSANPIANTGGAGPFFAAIPDDVDGDGDDDVVAVNLATSTLDWYENDGFGGTWTPHLIDSPVGQGVAVFEDLDLDGDVDLTFADTGFSGDLIWYENDDGAGLFWTRHVLEAATASPNFVAAGDLDADGDADAIAWMPGDNTLRQFRNDSIHRTAAFQPPTTHDSGLTTPNAVLGEDFDLDGDIDIMLQTLGYFSKVLYLNDGDGNFGPGSDIEVGSGTNTAMAAGDIDGDARPDVVSAESGSVYWLSNASGFGTRTNIASTGAHEPAIAVNDVDGDGDLDVFFTDDAGGGNFGLRWGDNSSGDGSSFTTRTVDLLSGIVPSDIGGADLDGDGDLDAFAASPDDDLIRWYANDGTGSFGVAQTVSAAMTNPFGAFAVDIDLDGDLDLVASSLGVGGEIRWFENTNGDATVWTNHLIAAIGATSGMAIDLDQDGDVDLVGANGWIENLGGAASWTLHFPLDASIGLASNTPGPYEDAADLDGDGDLDLLLADFSGGTLRSFENGAGQFALATTDTAPAQLDSAVIDDVLRIDIEHRGRVGDHPIELSSVNLGFLETSGAPRPLGEFELEAAVDEVRLYLDDGSGVFDGADTLIATEPDPFLPSGDLTLVASSLPAAELPFGGASRSYFVVFVMKPSFDTGAADTIQVVHETDPLASGLPFVSTAEDAVFDSPLRMEYVANVQTGDIQLVDANVDTDGDGLPDAVETNTGTFVSPTDTGTDPGNPDTDADGLSDGDEVNLHGSDPNVADTDGDGLSDGDEVNLHGSSPLLVDTDGDGLSDSDEVNVHGTDPALADSDGDGLDDPDELALGTDPNDPDTDDDTVNDGDDNCPFFDAGSQANSDPFPAGDACQCGDLDDDGDIDFLDVTIARQLVVGATVGVPFVIERCNVVGPEDGGVTDCDLRDVYLLRRIVDGTVGAVPGNVCNAYRVGPSP